MALNTWLAEGAANANTILAKQGNVGIGTPSPAEKLEVVGNVKATSNITTDGTVTAANASISGTLTAINASFSGAMSSTSLSTTGTVTAAKFVGEGAVPAGTITMWSGSPAAIPAGWALCDGVNGTPNLTGRFIVGYDPADADYNTIGNTGGEKRHALSVNEMPSHSHDFNYQEGRSDPTESGSEGQYVRASGTNRTFLNAITNTGGNQPHENRPPFFTLAYIIKLPY